MNTFSRYYGEVRRAHERVQQLRREADTERLLQMRGNTPAWRTNLAAQLHTWAERVEPGHTRTQAGSYQQPRGNVL